MIKRNFHGSDAYLLETANVIGNLLNKDLALFTAFDSGLDAGFVSAFQSKIDNALHFSRDGVITDQQAQKTVYVLSLMKQAKEKYQDVKYFTAKAFPNNEEVRNELGYNDIAKARKIQTEMIVFLDELFAACTKYSAELTAAGLPAATIASINTLRIDLLNANTDQESFVKSRPVLTAERINLLNEVYASLSQINEAAQIVFRGNEAKQNMFIYLANASSGEESQVITKDLPPNTVTEILNVPYDAGRIFVATNNGLYPIMVFLSVDGINQVGNSMTIAPNQSLTIQSNQLAAEGNKLMCNNPNPEVVSLELELG